MPAGGDPIGGGEAPGPAGGRRRSLAVRCGNFLFRRRKWVLAPGLLLLFLVFRPLYPQGSRRLDLWLDLLGLAVALAGQALRALTIGYVYIRRGGLSGQVYADDLVTGGIFNHSRNPLYLGNILIYAGLLIIFNNPWVYLIGLPSVVLVYLLLVAAEEDYLRKRFGARFEDYCRRVNRWLPDFRGLSRSLEGMRFNWRRLVVKEYGSASAWMLSTVLLLGYDTLAYSSVAREVRYLDLLGAMLVLIAAGWATARYLKKKRLLVATLPAPPL